MEKIIQYGVSKYGACHGPWLKKEDYKRVIEYLKEKIKEQNITFERVINNYEGIKSYCAREATRTKKIIWWQPEIEIKGRVYYYNIYFLFLGRNEEGELSIYQCGCTAEGYRDLYTDETHDSTLGRIYDVKIENLLPPTFSFIKDILSEEESYGEIEIIDQPDSGYEHDFQYIKLERDEKDNTSRWVCTTAEDIITFIEAHDRLLIRRLDSDPDFDLDETPYILTRAGLHGKNCISEIRGLVEKAHKHNCDFPYYSKYSTIYGDDKILIFKYNDTCHLVTDPEAIKAGVAEHLFVKNNYVLDEEVVDVRPITYDSTINNYKEVLRFKGRHSCLNMYGNSTSLIDGEQLYMADLRNGKSVLLGAGPLITDPKTKKSRRLVYTFNKD